MTPTRNILLDTSIILDGLSNLKSIGGNANLFVTDVVLRELDGNKKADGVKGYNAREFFRQLNQNPTEMIYGIPSTNQQLLKGDMLSVGEVADGIKIYTITRKWYKTKDINDSKIIEIAQDYKLTLKSKDQAQIVRARSVGVEGEGFEKIPTNSFDTIGIFIAILLTAGGYGVVLLVMFVLSKITNSSDAEKNIDLGYLDQQIESTGQDMYGNVYSGASYPVGS